MRIYIRGNDTFSEQINHPCACVNCKYRSEPRPLGQVPDGWTKVDGYYVCPQCRPYLRVRPGQGTET